MKTKRKTRRKNMRKGRRHNKLVAIKKVGEKVFPGGGKQPIWLFQCDCGNQIECLAMRVISGKKRSCGCMWVGKETYMSGVANKTREPGAKNTPEQDYSFMARKAWKHRYRDGDLAFEDFLRLSQLPCHYCGKMQTNTFKYKGEAKFRYNGLDRLDSSRGHDLDNVVPCCIRCNQAKSDMLPAEFAEWLNRVHEYWIKPGAPVPPEWRQSVPSLP